VDAEEVLVRGRMGGKGGTGRTGETGETGRTGRTGRSCRKVNGLLTKQNAISSFSLATVV
jgi:hypothetical protein